MKTCWLHFGQPPGMRVFLFPFGASRHFIGEMCTYIYSIYLLYARHHSLTRFQHCTPADIIYTQIRGNMYICSVLGSTDDDAVDNRVCVKASIFFVCVLLLNARLLGGAQLIHCGTPQTPLMCDLSPFLFGWKWPFVYIAPHTIICTLIWRSLTPTGNLIISIRWWADGQCVKL